MLSLFLLALIGVVFISLLSLSGVITLIIHQHRLKQVIDYLVSFAIGSLLGGVWWHLIPESFQGIDNSTLIGFLVLIGLFIFLILEKMIRHHHCHDPNCQQQPAGWLILFSDGLHNLIDGMLIAASFMVSPVIGWTTVMAVAGHEIAQEIGDFSILIHSGFSVKRALFFNFISSLTSVLGVILVFSLGGYVKDQLIYLLPVTAGGFLYIALADLIPELHRSRSQPISHLLQFGFIFLGLTVILVLK